MKKYLIMVMVLLFAVTLFSQTVDPRPPRTTWKKELAYIQGGTMTLTYKTLTSPTLAGTIPISGATNYTQVNAASGSANPWDYTGTLGIMNGSDNFTLFDINLTNANHTGSSNVVTVLDVANITGDAEATESAIIIGSGWDYGLTSASPVSMTSTLALSGAMTTSSTIGITTVNAAGGSANPLDFTGTLGIMDGSDDFTLLDINLTNADHTGSSNVVKALDIAAITGDAQATETAISIGSGWDYGIQTASGVNIGTDAETITQVDTVKTGGGVVRWMKITVGGVAFWAPADTSTVK